MLNFILGVFLAAAIILLVVCGAITVRSIKRNSAFLECTGTIISFNKNTHGAMWNESNYTISPVVEYTVNGKRYEFIGNYCSTSMRVGDEVALLYNPEDPSVVSMKTGTIVAPLITGTLGFVFLIGAAICFVIKSRGSAW